VVGRGDSLANSREVDRRHDLISGKWELGDGVERSCVLAGAVKFALEIELDHFQEDKIFQLELEDLAGAQAVLQHEGDDGEIAEGAEAFEQNLARICAQNRAFLLPAQLSSRRITQALDRRISR